MATDAANTGSASTADPLASGHRNSNENRIGANGTGRYGAAVERQLRKTQGQVKFVDLCTGLMELLAGVTAYLLVLALVDHWIVGLGVWARFLALAGLLGGCGWHFTTTILPLLTRRINPLYAARSIEQGTPALKNSLINFLMFRNSRSSLHRVVYEAMEQKAATDLASVPVDTAVDRSRMIKVGYVLAGVLTVSAAYAILSPKDPLQTIARVAAPWRAISRPSRIVIEEVQPGSLEVIQGQFVDVVARVRGARPERDTVSLVYSTRDGQTVQRHVTMVLDENGVAYHGRLPEETAGLQHDLEYWIESGDARSDGFDVTLSPAPSIAVERIEFEYPDYTRLPHETTRREGNIRGLEGTRVTVFAVANKPIRSAGMTFNPLESLDGPRPPVKLAMDHQGQTARLTFTLALMEDRLTPVHGSYQLSFVSQDGDASRQPVLHQIDVVPDLGPEVAILDPTQHRITVPLSGRRKIEVRAIDPDFGLSRLKLRGVAGGTDVLDALLFEDPRGRRGQTIGSYVFVPSQLGLAVDDQVTFWAVAEDNQTALPGSNGGANQAAPNVARTGNYVIEVVADPRRPASGHNRSADEDGTGNANRPDAAGDEPPAARDPAADRGTPERENTPPSESPAEQPPSEDSGEGSAESSGESESGSPDDKETKADDGSGGAEAGSDSGSPDAASQRGKGGAGAPQQGQSQSGDASSADGAGGSTPQSSDPSGNSNAGQGGSGEPEQLHDGEVFERVLEKMKQQAEGKGRPDPSGSESGERQGGSSADAQADQRDRGADGQQPAGNANDQSKPRGDADGESAGSDTQSQPFSQDSASPPKSSGQDSPQDGQGAQQPDVKRGAGDQKAGNPGEGGDTNPTSGDQQGKQKPDVPGAPDQREKEPGSGDNGESGAGQDSRDTEGSGSVESTQDETVTNRDKPKQGNPDSSEPQQESDPGATDSKKQSDSEGGESGDKSGGGKKGPGQGANQAGNDSAGQNSSADDGAGASSEAGDGETSDAAGNKQEANGKTGAAGDRQGKGASSRKDPNGGRESNGPQPPSPEAAASQENRLPRDTQQGGSGDRPGQHGPATGGGVPSDVRHHSGLDPNLEAAAGDAANLEYARKATDLVIDYLKDMEARPDPDLLKELGWSQEDMRRFVERWQGLKRGATEQEGGRELDESLRSLGLRSPQSKLRQRRVRDDRQRGMSESGNVSQPPAAYRDLFDAFRKGAARVGER